jgi:hypothetical protein
MIAKLLICMIFAAAISACSDNSTNLDTFAADTFAADTFAADTHATDAATTGDLQHDGTTVDLTPGEGLPGTIAIYVKGDLTKPTFNDGFAGQTPASYQIAISSYHVLKSATDPAPTLCFDHGQKPFVVQVDKDNLVGSCATKAVPSGTYTHGRTKVAWARYSIAGVYHVLGQKLPGTFTFFRAYSDVTYNNKPYKAGHGSITFSGLTTVEIPFVYGPMPSMPGVGFETIKGEFFMTFKYSKPLPIIKDDPGEHWARFHWKVGDAFRWADLPLPGYVKQTWDVAAIFTNTELVKLHGVSGYYVTSSKD